MEAELCLAGDSEMSTAMPPPSGGGRRHLPPEGGGSSPHSLAAGEWGLKPGRAE